MLCSLHLRLGTNVTVENAMEILKQTCNPNEDNYRDVKENAIGFTAQNIASTFLRLLPSSGGHLPTPLQRSI